MSTRSQSDREGPADCSLEAVTREGGLTFSQDNLQVENKGSTFESARGTVTLRRGKWYYEVKVLTDGLMQIGWARKDDFRPNASGGDGVGDDDASWAYDGYRKKKWYNGSTNYGERWSTGDIIGVALDLDSNQVTFYRNGRNLGRAFDSVSVGNGICPAISLQAKQKALLNFGKNAFQQTIPSGFSAIALKFDERKSRVLNELFDKYNKISMSPTDLRSSTGGNDPDTIRGDGTLQLATDLGMTDFENDPLLLVLAYKTVDLEATVHKALEFYREPFVTRLSLEGVGGFDELKSRLVQWKRENLNDKDKFKKFYAFVFDYSKEDKKILLLDEAEATWKMLLTSRWPLLPRWLQFLRDTSAKSVSKDLWVQTLEFAEQHPKDLSAFDAANSSWPSTMDEFAEWSADH